MTGKEYKERINSIIPDDAIICATTDGGVFDGWHYKPYKEEEFFQSFKPIPEGSEVNVGYGTDTAAENEYFNVPMRY